MIHFRMRPWILVAALTTSSVVYVYPVFSGMAGVRGVRDLTEYFWRREVSLTGTFTTADDEPVTWAATLNVDPVNHLTGEVSVAGHPVISDLTFVGDLSGIYLDASLATLSGSSVANIRGRYSKGEIRGVVTPADGGSAKQFVIALPLPVQEQWDEE